MINLEKIKSKYVKFINEFIKNKKVNIKYIIVISLTIFVIRYIYLFHNFNLKYKSDENTKRYNVLVERNISLSEDKISYLVKYESSYFILNIYVDEYSKKKISKDEFINKYGNFNYGDKVDFRGKIQIPKLLNNPYEFNYKRYLNSKNIVGIISTYDVKKKDERLGNPILKLAYFLREDIGKKVDEKLPSKEAQLYKSMIYGDDRNLSNEIKEDFKKDGISHIIAVSGSNISTILLLLCIFINPKKKNIKVLLYTFIIILFCVIAAMELSIIRASIMAIITVVFQRFDLKINIYQKILLAVLLMILYNPWCIFNAGFMLSYFAIIGIVIYSKTISSLFNVYIFEKIKILKTSVSKINKKSFKYYIYLFLDYIIKAFAITLSVYIFILPLQIYYFGEFELTSIIANIVISILTFFISVLGSISFFLVYIPVISDVIFNSTFFVLRLVINVSDFLASLNLPCIKLPKPNIFTMYIYYILILIHTFKNLYIYKIEKATRKKVLNFIDFVTIIYILYNISVYIYTIHFENYVYFFNVEQGNMAIIRKNKKVIVLDMGSTKKNIAANTLNTFLKAKAIQKIDMVILTHMHDDHINGLEGVLKQIKIDKVLYGIPKVKDTSEYIKIKEVIEQNNISTINVEEYEYIEYLGIRIDILSPPKHKKVISKDEANSNSLILLVSLAKNNFVRNIQIQENKNCINYLFMGDATIESEKSFLARLDESVLSNNKLENRNITNMVNITDIKSKLNDIFCIQIGHHGSKTSTSKEFLDSIFVKTAVISALKEKFGHPHEETLEKLKEKNIKIKITQKDGFIKF
jgi:competence protein ComEC